MLHSPAPCLPKSSICAAVCVALAIALAGCEPADPLEPLRQQQEAGDFAGTVESLRELVMERPNDPETNFLYGRALVFSGQPTLATWALREAMKDPEWRVKAGLQLAYAGLATGDYNEVVETTTDILEEEPENQEALLFRAQAQAHWRKDAEAALADANRLLETDPDLLEAYEPRILALLELERYDEATEALEEVGRRMEDTDSPEHSLAWHCSTTAIFAAEGGEGERAHEIWQECLEKYPTDPTVISNATHFYEANGDWVRSLEVVRNAFEEQPENRSLRVALADRLRLMGERAEGEALLREATEVEDPRQAARAWSDLASYRHAMGEHTAAAEALRQAIERLREVEEPGPQLLFRYADALLVSGHLGRAQKVAEEIEVPAQRTMILARVAQERGQHARALEQFDEALRVWPDNAYARYYAARAAEQVGDFERALEEYRYSIRISVGATDARTRAAKLLIAQGRPLLAYQILFLEVGKYPLETEGELLSMYLMANVANPNQLKQSIAELAARNPALLPRALVRGAEGAAQAAGPAAALNLLRGAPGLDYTHPRAAPVLRAIVRFADAAGKPEVAAGAIDTALAARPDAAVFHEIRGLHLELSGAEPEAVRAEYARAVELAPGNAGALAGLGRLALEEDPARAVALFDRAAAAEPSEPGPKLAAARALVAHGALDAAAQRLEALLEEHPLQGEAAAELVSLDLAREAVTPRTLESARRAARFVGSAESYEQLGRVLAELDQPEEAAQARRHAQVLRERGSRGRQPEAGGTGGDPPGTSDSSETAEAAEAEAAEG